jgi:hypothetical protein
MLELTEKNHFKFGYDGTRWFEDRKGPADAGAETWTVAYGRASRPVLDFRHECIEAARRIKAASDREPWVLYSGDVAGEIAVQAFRFAAVPFTAAITAFEDNLNRAEVRHSVKFCEMHKVDYRILRLGVRQFFEGGAALELAKRAHCADPTLLPTLWAMDRADGYPVVPRGECSLAKASGPWALVETERGASVYRHLLAQKRAGTAAFFQYTPELVRSFLEDPFIADVMKGPAENVQAQVREMHGRYFLLAPRPEGEGLANTKNLHDAIRPELERQFGSYGGVATTPIAEVLA